MSARYRRPARGPSRRVRGEGPHRHGLLVEAGVGRLAVVGGLTAARARDHGRHGAGPVLVALLVREIALGVAVPGVTAIVAVLSSLGGPTDPIRSGALVPAPGAGG